MSMVKTNYTLTVYRNTGFNGIDIPAEPSVLENADKHTYTDTYFLREDLDNPVIRVNDSYRNLSDVDYVKLVANSTINNQPNTFYYFAVPHADAGGTTSLSLDLDALLTCGGAKNLDYISGWQERGHITKNEDVLFGNIAAEDWCPSQILVNADFEDLDINNTPDLSGLTGNPDNAEVIISTIDLALAGINTGEIEVIKGMDGTNEVMYFPDVKPNTHPTIFRMSPVSSSSPYQSFKIPNTTLYDANNNDVKTGIGKLFSAGQLQLQNSYTIEGKYIDSIMVEPNTPGVAGIIDQITGYGDEQQLQGFDFEYTDDGYTPKNKKCYDLFRGFTLINKASGSSITKKPHELKKGSNTNPTIYIWADMSSTGKPFARFLTDSIPDENFMECVEGAQWVCHQVLIEGASGSLWNAINASYNQQTLDRNIAINGYNNDYITASAEINAKMLNADAGFGMSKNILGTLGIIGGETNGFLNNGMDLAQNAIKTNLSAQQLLNNYDKEMLNNEMQRQQIRQAMNENRIGLLKANGVVAPTIMFTPNPNLAMYGNNIFCLYETRLSKADLMSLDDYFQRYGYNGLHRKLTKDCFNTRQYYSYVQAFDVNFKVTGKSIGLRIRNKAISQLNNGVRVWKVLPDASYYETN